jgi:tripartite-type tricarboxylate transporter receptor subunit TctC
MTDLIEQHKAGKVRILATASTKRNAIAPEVSTFVEQGLRDVQGSSWFGLYTHAKAPEGSIRAINAAVNKALQATDVRERLAKIGMEATGGSPEDLAGYMKRDTERWGPVVKASGFRAD